MLFTESNAGFRAATGGTGTALTSMAAVMASILSCENIAGTVFAVPAGDQALPAKPFLLARQIDAGDLLQLDRAGLHQLIDGGFGSAGNLGAVDRHGRGAAMVIRRPARGNAAAFQTGRHPVLLLVHALLDLGSGNAAVLGRPFHRFLHEIGGADAGDVVDRAVGAAGSVRDLGDFLDGLHAGSFSSPDHSGADREDHAVGGLAGGLHGVLVHAPDIAHELDL